ncbi:circadian regulator timeout [Leptinotarsa decemlineata]|uniref:circadian regulator timeout n=1 Tax=Leptinotarsa decemlineata TaxID=7539 RepID=UPI003D309883
MSSLLSAEIAATCSALGYFDAAQNKYFADSNSLETVKDLVRYLRRDDENHDIRRQLGQIKVLQTDLLPLLKSYHEEDDLFDVLLRLIMNLTTPPLLLWNFEVPKEKSTRNFYMQVEDHLKSYKEAFTEEGVWAVLSTRLSKILEVDNAERGEENGVKIERILILVRNVLFVPADASERRPDNDASLHDQVVWALQKSGMLDIILFMTSSADEQAYYMYILEIIFFLLREQKPSDLANAALVRSQSEKIRDEAELLAIRHRETTQKQQKTKIYAGTRHSRFGGTFVVKSMKSISDNELIYHKPLNKLDSLNFDTDKRKPKTPKNRLPVTFNSTERRSAFSIRLVLKEFCVEFLYGAYNSLMRSVRDNLVRSGGESHDESVYFWAVKFFMAFNRSYRFEVKLVSETMSIQMFHYIQQRSEHNFDLMQTDKKKILLWSQRLHKALLAYCELLNTLYAMDKSSDATVREASKVIKSNIFYVPEYREFILTLLVNYEEVKMSDLYLKDLLETQHIFLKMFESFCKTEGSIMVQKKVRAKKAKRKKSKAQVVPESMEALLEKQWDETGPQLSAVLESGGDFLTDVVPFDAASEVPIDEQKVDAMKKIQAKLRDREFESAIGLIRAAREVWPENDSFGSSTITPEEEFLALREIFFAELGNVEPPPPQQNSDDSEDDDEEEEEGGPRYSETDFNFDDFIKRLPHPKIIKACGLALRTFETNSVNTNHCILKLLHRIAFDCKMYVMVFQLSIFRTFQKIMSLKDAPQHKELIKFATYILRQFFKVAENNELVFLEAVFWTAKREAYEIENGYGTFEKTSTASKTWSEEEEDELRRLFMEHQQNQVEEDVVDWICSNLIDNTKSRRIVLKKLKELYLLANYKPKKKSVGRMKPPQNWGAEEEAQLRELYEEFKDAMDPLGCIMSRLEIVRPKNRVVEKLLVMGLVQDKKELRKKRAKSGKRKSNVQGGQSSEGFSDSEAGSDDSTRSVPRLAKNPVKRPSKKSAKVKKKSPPVRAPRSELAKLLLENVEHQHQEALEWLKDSLSDAIEDYEDGNDVGIPLVPIMDYAVAAMEHEAFQKLLKGFGVSEPFVEQEAYWRIPGDIPVDVLTGLCELIQGALDGTLEVQENGSATGPGGSESEEDYLEVLNRNKGQQAAKDSSNEPVDDHPEVSKYKGARKRITKNLSESEDEHPGSNIIEDQEPLDKSLPSTSKNILSESDEEPGQKRSSQSAVNPRNSIETDSEDEGTKETANVINGDTVAGKNMNVLESDSDDDVGSIQKRVRSPDSDSGKPVKRSRVIESDDDDE